MIDRWRYRPVATDWQPVPNLRRLAVLINLGNPASVLERHGIESAAQSLGVSTLALEIRAANDIAPAFKALKGNAEAVYVCADPLLNTNRTSISMLASSERLPMMLDNREFVAAGGLMSYGPNIPDLFRRAADYVDKILKGTKPADLPVEEPTKFNLVINIKIAKLFGLTIPQTLLATADEVIE